VEGNDVPEPAQPADGGLAHGFDACLAVSEMECAIERRADGVPLDDVVGGVRAAGNDSRLVPAKEISGAIAQTPSDDVVMGIVEVDSGVVVAQKLRAVGAD